MSDQAARINVAKYAQHVRRGPSLRVAVVGAGLAGLTCARTLADHNITVTVFEKSRGLGGRCATRRDGPWQFDHGAQYFTVRDARLAPWIHSWQERGIITPWGGALAVFESGVWTPAKTGVRRFVAVPGMSALGAHLAEDLDVQRNVTVREITRDGSGWRLRDADGGDLGTFDIVLTCIPAPQAIALLGDAAPALASQAATAVMHPTWAAMVVLQDRTGFPYDGAFLNDHPSLGWISRDASKPARSAQDTWVLHANRAWSTSHLDDDAEQVALALSTAFTDLCDVTAPVVHARAHRWRYALPDPVTDSPALFDGTLGLGAGGDWCGGPRIEGALLSGSALAGRVLSHAHVAMTDPAMHPTDLFS